MRFQRKRLRHSDSILLGSHQAPQPADSPDRVSPLHRSDGLPQSFDMLGPKRHADSRGPPGRDHALRYPVDQSLYTPPSRINDVVRYARGSFVDAQGNRWNHWPASDLFRDRGGRKIAFVPSYHAGAFSHRRSDLLMHRSPSDQPVDDQYDDVGLSRALPGSSHPFRLDRIIRFADSRGIAQ
ncbi:MAG: hypothetical protein D6753_01630 [Planctomycetota bacterium]|nr:MAG: hypothetical protein D6753_01630 [Planctomycetota bacterium]